MSYSEVETQPAPRYSRRAGSACKTCGATDPVLLFEGEDHLTGHRFPVAQCRCCGLSYVDPQPSREELGRYYSDEYYGNRHAFLSAVMTALRVRKLPPGPSGRSLLDIGCGRGDFLLACRRYGWQVAGVEQSHAPIMQQKAALAIDVYSAEDLGSVPSNAFDVVTLWHVFEHTPDPVETLTHVQRVLKAGGILLIEVPNFGGWQGRFGARDWFHLDVPRHLFHFDRRSLRQLLERQGLRPYRWQTFSLEYDGFGAAQTLLNRLCVSPNHLFQLLIHRRVPSGVVTTDTVLSLALFPLLLGLALPVSLAAAACGQGGVLRVWATKE